MHVVIEKHITTAGVSEIYRVSLLRNKDKTPQFDLSLLNLTQKKISPRDILKVTGNMVKKKDFNDTPHLRLFDRLEYQVGSFEIVGKIK